MVTVVTFFFTGKYFQWPVYQIIIEIGFIAIFLFSFLKAFVKTKFWSMVHSSSKNLDEREMQVVLSALKYAYSIFTIICLVIIYGFATIGFHPIDVVLAGGLLYLAHTLPAAIVGWNEKIISTDDD